MADRIVNIDSTVTLKNGASTVTYHLVSPNRANPFEKKISIESPIGKVIFKQKEKSTVKVQTPQGEKEYIIVKVEG